jgi:hypothetical protein
VTTLDYQSSELLTAENGASAAENLPISPTAAALGCRIKALLTAKTGALAAAGSPKRNYSSSCHPLERVYLRVWEIAWTKLTAAP